ERRAGGAVHQDRGLRERSQIAVAGDVVRMRVRLDDATDTESLLASEADVLADTIASRIDDDGLSRLATADEIRETAGLLVQELLEDHGRDYNVGKSRRVTASPGRGERWGCGGHVGAPTSIIPG